MSEDKVIEKTNEEKLHYQSLIDFFKYLVGAVIVLTGIVTWIIGSSLSEFQSHLTKNLDGLTVEISNMKKDSKTAIKESNEEADKQIGHLRKNIESFLNMTKDITTMQISTLREDARNLALSSARLRVEEAFKENDIQIMVKDAATKEINKSLEEIVKKEMERTKSTFEFFPLLTNAQDRIRWGDRKSVDLLDSLAHYAEDITVRNMAEELLTRKGIDYDEASFEYELKDDSLSTILNRLKIKYSYPLSAQDSINIKDDFVEIIKTDNDLYRVTYAFIALRKLTGIQIKTFDINTVKKLYKND